MALKRTTIREVAREAGVSTQTVSRVLNERPDVAPETRQRVLAIIAELGFQPSVLARSLIHQRSLTIGVVVAGLRYTGPALTLSGISEQAEALGYALTLKELPRFDSQTVKPLLRDLIARQVDGIIWAVPEAGANRGWLPDLLPTLPVPIVLLTMHEMPGVTVVANDNRLGGRLAAEHLIAQGRRVIGHVAGPLLWWEARERKTGWEEALLGADLPAEPRQVAEGDWTPASGELAFRQLMTQCPDLDAVFVANDQMALSVLLVAGRSGRRVPDDLVVVGYDDIPEAAYFSPPLTTIRQDSREMGRMAIRQVVRLIKAAKSAPDSSQYETIWLKPQLVIRESSGACQEGG